jgi:YD repeat-containing protein
LPSNCPQTDRYYTGATLTSTTDNTTTVVATFTQYNAQGNVISTRRYSGVLISITADTSITASVTIDKSALTASGALISSTSTVYDALGRVAENADSAGLRSGSIYYDNGQVQYSGPLKSTAPLGGPYELTDFVSYSTYIYQPYLDIVTDPLGHATTTVRDGLGREIGTYYADGTATHTQYDTDQGDLPGSHVRHIDQLNQATDDYSDLAGRLTDVYLPAVTDGSTSSTTPVRPHWHYEYDANGNEILQRDPKGHETTWTYNSLNQQTSRTLPDSEVESFTYDSFGREQTHTDFGGNLATYTYYVTGPQTGMLESIVYTDTGKPTQTSSYTYDNLGRPLTVTDDSGATTSHYDDQGNLIEAETPEGTIHYVFDPATNQHIETFTDNTDTIYNYDEQGRLWHVKVTKLNGVVLPAALITSYTYDAVGDKKTETLPNGDVTTYDYDSVNRLTDLITTQGSTPIFSQRYVLNDDGTRKSVDESQGQPDGSTNISHTAWTYDTDQRLTDETYTSSVAGQGYEDKFAYDLSGNRVREDINGGDSSAAGLTIRYSYNNDNQLTDEVEKQHDGSTVYETTNSYDANGSLTQSIRTGAGAETDSFGYDLRNRMTSSTVGGVTSTDVYRDDDIRVAQTSGSTTTTYLIDDNNPTGQPQPVEEHLNGATAPHITYIISDAVIGQANASAVINLLRDGQGNTRLVTSATGVVLAAYNYDAFRNPRGFLFSDALTTHLTADGTADVATNLEYQGFRYRENFWFPQMDNLRPGPGDLSDANLYAYVGGNPINVVDPSGHEGELVDLLLAMGAASLVMALHSSASNALNSSISFAQGKTTQGLKYLRNEVQDLLSIGLSGGPGGINPEPMLAVQSVTQMAEVSAEAAADLAAQSLVLFSSSVKNFNGQKYVSRPGSSEQDVPDYQGNPVRVVGQSGSSSTTGGHDEMIEALKDSELQQPGRLMIFMQKSLGSSSGRQFLSRLIPDLTVARMEDGQIKIDMYEVKSNSQTEDELQRKLDGLMNLLPNGMRGDARVVKPNSAP